MPYQVKALPTEPVGEIQAVSGDFLDGVRTRQLHGQSVSAQVNKDVRKPGAVEIGNRGIVVGVVAQPVVHDKHAFRSGPVLHVSQACAR